MAFSPITSRQIDGEKMETVTDFIFLGSKVAADGDCSQEIKRHLLLGRKAMTNLDSVLKSRDIILPTKVHIVKAMIFPVVMYECESWTIKKAEHWRIDAFELWCWKRPWCLERLKAGEEGDNWGCSGWMASTAQRTCVWASSGSWWWTGKPGMLQSTGSQRVRHNWMTELNWWIQLSLW